MIRKNYLLMFVLTLLVFAGQMSAQSLSLAVSGGGSTTVSGAGTEISVDVSQMGVTASVNAIQIVFDIDTSVIALTGAPAGFIISGGNAATVLSLTPVPVPASVSFTFTTATDVTGMEFSIGISSISLDGNPLPVPLPAAILFNSPSLHLDTQIESPAQNNSALTLSEKKPGDTIQFQLFAPDVAGQGFYAIQFELSLQGKRLSSYISSSVSGGWISQVSGSGNLSLTRLSVTPVSVPSSGYLGQIDLEVTGALTSDDMLMVAQASLDGRQLDVSSAVISFEQAVQCPGDFDKNGMINIPDFLLFVKVFGTSSGDATFNALMDMDGNGAVGIPDFLLFVKVFGTTCGTTSLPPPPPPPPGDRAALVALYNATNGDNWTNNTNWLSDRPIGEWHGVTTNANGRVVDLYMPGNQLRGQIPSALGNLSKLTRLHLYNNQLSGAIPSELGQLTNLTSKLDLGNNQLSGAIPSELRQLTNLTNLRLSNNRLNGPIPTWIGSLSNLTWLSLGGNPWSGSVPAELGNLSKLESLELRSMRLSGAIPTWIGNLSNLKFLGLYDNQLSGAIPTWIGNLSNLEILELSSNTALSGELPTSLVDLTNLQQLHLDGTQLCAPTDAVFQAWLQGIENKRGVVDCGSGSGSTLVSIPDANLRAVVEDSLGKARGAPITQAEMATLTRLEAPNSNISDLTGLEFAIRLSYLTLGRVYVGSEDNVNRNEISDLSPLSNLTNLTNLNLANNDISDLSPLSNLTNLTFLGLYNNSIEDLSPLSNLTNLTRLDLALNGGISDLSPLSNLTNLTALGLESNSIEVLSPLSNLTRLTDLRLARNYISDLSPLSNLTRLTRLNLVLNGSIRDLSPLSNLTRLTNLSLGVNDISDLSPLSNLIRLTDLDLIENSISDLSPLVANTGLGRGDRVDVRNNPLSATSRNTHIPTLQGRGVEVLFGALPTAGKPAVVDDQEPRMGGVSPEDRGYNSLRR